MWGPIKGRNIRAGKKLVVPTGLAFNIPVGYSIRWHPKSGLACKHGITLTNCEGIIDSDYHHEVFVCVWNTSDENDYYLRQGDKICQAELVRNEHYHIEETLEQPQKTTTRDGGFGSTGK
jgi:dUTP pyrophosphatase